MQPAEHNWTPLAQGRSHNSEKKPEKKIPAHRQMKREGVKE